MSTISDDDDVARGPAARPASGHGHHIPTRSELTENDRILKGLRDAYKGPKGTAHPACAAKAANKAGAVAGAADAPVPLREAMLRLGLKCVAPRERVNVMLIGNHSAGKSSFINWYINDPVQKTGVAIETSGFTVVHSGKKKDRLAGRATMQLFDWLEGLEDEAEPVKNVIPNLSTEISTSTERRFPSVNLIDTPGLVDGNFQYPYEVDDTILFFAEFCDRVLIFFDPQGQALCEKTRGVVFKLYQQYPERVTYYLSKADTVEDQNDRMKVVTQITANLAALTSQHKFELPPIYLPSKAEGLSDPIPNNIDRICEMIEDTISETVQRGLDNLKDDCKSVISTVESRLGSDAAVSARNKQRWQRRALLFLCCLLVSVAVPLCMFLAQLRRWFPGMTGSIRTGVPEVGPHLAHVLEALTSWVPKAIPSDSEGSVLTSCAAVLGTYYLLSYCGLFWQYGKTKTPAEIVTLERYKSTAEALLVQQNDWYREYLNQSTQTD